MKRHTGSAQVSSIDLLTCALQKEQAHLGGSPSRKGTGSWVVLSENCWLQAAVVGGGDEDGWGKGDGRWFGDSVSICCRGAAAQVVGGEAFDATGWATQGAFRAIVQLFENPGTRLEIDDAELRFLGMVPDEEDVASSLELEGDVK